MFFWYYISINHTFYGFKERYFMNGLTKKCLITGGAGFIGSQLAKRLLDQGCEVTVIDNLFTGSKSNIYDLLDNPRFTFLMHDVTQPFWGQFDEIYNLYGKTKLSEFVDYVLEKNKKSIESDSSSRELGESSKELLAKLPHIKYIYEDSEASYFFDRCIYKVYANIDVCDNSESLFEIFKERANELKDEHNINVY